jgi:hypothetical protein
MEKPNAVQNECLEYLFELELQFGGICLRSPLAKLEKANILVMEKAKL